MRKNGSVRKVSCLRSLRVIGDFLMTCTLFAFATFAHAENLSDPTRPSGYSVAATAQKNAISAARLTLVRLGPQPLAIISGKTVRVGDAVDGQRVAAIQPGRVVLSGADGTHTLLLSPSLQSATNSSSFKSIKRRPTL